MVNVVHTNECENDVIQKYGPNVRKIPARNKKLFKTS